MAEIATAWVAVRADTKRLKPDIEKGVGDVDMEGHGKKAGSGYVKGFSTAAAGLAAVGIGAFLKGSIDSAKEAEVAQGRLSDAFAKFPALADVNRSSLDRLNEALSKKTRFDDDATASGQAVLAQFGLTGQQIQQLTPLLADYAAKTGRDMPSAADALGKALLGNGRALKEIGIDFQDTGSVGSNFDQIMGGLRTQVGGFAEKEGKSAVGQSEILKNRFGELQETVGTKLLPALTGLVEKLTGLVDFIARNIDVIGPLVLAIGGLAAGIWLVNAAMTAYVAVSAAVKSATVVWTGVQWLLNAALTANPIGLIIVAIAALVAAVIIAYKNSETFRDVVQKTWEVISAVVKFAWENVLKPYFTIIIAYYKLLWEGVQLLAQIFKETWDLIVAIVRASVDAIIGFITGFINRVREGFDIMKQWVIDRWNATWDFVARAAQTWVDKVTGIAGAIKDNMYNVFNGIVGVIRGPINSVIGLINGLIDKVNVILPGNLNIPKIPLLAGGGEVPGFGQRGFATGGRVFGPGGGTDDRVPIMASAGEWVIREKAARVLGKQFMSLINFADRNGIADVAGDPASRLISSRTIRDPLAAAVFRFATGGSVPSVQDWIRAQDPKPYIWGGAGPGGFDCSGITSAVFGMLTGRGGGSGQRYFTTASNFGALGFKSGVGAYTVGVGGGHMAGNLAGLPFEARSTATGIFVGNSAKSVTSFPNTYFLPQVGGEFISGGGGGGIIDFGAIARKLFDAATGPVMAAVDAMTSSLGLPGSVIRGVAYSGRDAIRDKLSSFDRGGWLPPGLSLAYNGTGRPERVSPGGGGNTYVFPNYIGSRDELVRELNRLQRQGRV